MSELGIGQRSNRTPSWLVNFAGLLILGLILWLGGVEAWQQIVGADWRYVLAAFLVTLLWNFLAAWRWALVTGQVISATACPPFRYFFTYHVLGMLSGQIMPITVGMLGIRPVALHLSRGISLKRAALSVFVDKLFDPILAVLLVVPGVLYLAGWVSLLLALGLMGGMAGLGLVLMGWGYERSWQWLTNVGSRLARALAGLPIVGRRLMRPFAMQLDRLAVESLVPNRLAARAFAVTLLMYTLFVIRLIFIAQAMRLEIPWYLLAMGACVTQLTIIFSVTPGSVGFLEAGWAAVLGLAGLSAEQILFFVIGRRAMLLAFTLVNTLLAFAWIRESPARLFRAVLAASRRPADPRAAYGEG